MLSCAPASIECGDLEAGNAELGECAEMCSGNAGFEHAEEMIHAIDDVTGNYPSKCRGIVQITLVLSQKKSFSCSRNRLKEVTYGR